MFVLLPEVRHFPTLLAWHVFGHRSSVLFLSMPVSELKRALREVLQNPEVIHVFASARKCNIRNLMELGRNIANIRVRRVHTQRGPIEIEIWENGVLIDGNSYCFKKKTRMEALADILSAFANQMLISLEPTPKNILFELAFTMDEVIRSEKVYYSPSILILDTLTLLTKTRLFDEICDVFHVFPASGYRILWTNKPREEEELRELLQELRKEILTAILNS